MGFKPRQRVVTVYWVDTAMLTGWHAISDEDRILECATTGFLIDKDNERVRVAHAVTEQGIFAEVTCIPMGCVLRIEYHRGHQRKS